MIDPAHRRALLANFPLGTDLAIVAPRGAFDELVAVRADPATHLYLLGDLPPTTAGNLIVEGLDAVLEPSLLLAALRAAAPHARLFALVANAAYVPALVTFFGGAASAPGRPLVRADLENLFAAGDWQLLTIEPIEGAEPLAWQPAPAAITYGNLTIDVPDLATLERVRPAALLAIADPR